MALTHVAPPLTEPRRTVAAMSIALRSWTRRQVLAAIGLAIGFALLIGVPTVLIPNPVFGREIPVVAWNYPVWIVTSLLAGMLAATYVRPARAVAAVSVEGAAPAGQDSDAAPDAASRFGMVGGVLAWFAVGCPVCNKIALLALGYSGALTWFAPVQPYLAAIAMLLTGGALVFRLRGQVFCPTPVVPRG
jgi:hypothetical protein